METLNLVKGQKLDLSKGGLVAEDGSLNNVFLGAGWDMSQGGDDVDLDILVAIMSAGQVQKVGFFNDKTPCPGIQLSDDNRTGEGDGDDEFIDITAADLADDIDKLVFGINIFDAASKGQNFGMVESAYMRIVNPETEEEVALFDLEFDASTATGLIFGELIKRNGKWYFSATGEEFNGDVNDFVAKCNG